MWEVAFKIGLTIAILAAGGGALHWIWTHQLDPTETVARLLRRPVEALEPPGWIATRDPSKIYQDGAPVGDVVGDVQISGSRVLFNSISNTGQLNRSEPFEYRRMRLRVVRFGSWTGESNVVIGTKRYQSLDVLESVECELVE